MGSYLNQKILNIILPAFETYIVWWIYQTDPDFAPFLALYAIIKGQYWLRSHQK